MRFPRQSFARAPARSCLRHLTSSPPFEAAEIKGGSYAVLRHKGPYDGLMAAYNWFYGLVAA